MLQQIFSRTLSRALTVAIALLLVVPIACEEPASPRGSQAPEEPVRIASLVPAVTNMLLELDAPASLVAVSNYDTDPRVADLPRVGDLLSVDWEQILEVRPTVMVVQQSPDKLPAGLKERADELEIRILSIQLTDLRDIVAALAELGRLFDPPRDAEWTSRFQSALAQHSAPPRTDRVVPVLIALSPDFHFVAGRENYLDDLLDLAGGGNVIPPEMPPYPSLDDEALLQLRPQRVIVFLPDATDAQVQRAEAAFQRLAEVWELPDSALSILSDPYAMVPGWSVTEVLEHFRAAVVEVEADG